MGVGRLASADRAFERLYKRHVEDVYRYSLAVLANDADAEDVVQTTFLNAYRSYESGTRPKEVGELADRDRAQRLPPAISHRRPAPA